MYLFNLFIIQIIFGYYCQAKNENLSIDSLFTSPNLKEGKQFLITCQASSNLNDLTFDWYFNGNKITPDENLQISQHEKDHSLVIIKAMSLDYSGEYTCKVKSSSLNLFASKNISVKLNVKPRFIVEPSDLQIKLNSVFRTKCEATAVPKPSIKWIKLSSNGEEDMVIEGEELSFNFTKSDLKFWKCVATNEIGSIEKRIQLNYYIGILLNPVNLSESNGKPLLLDLYVPPNLKENQNVKLSCDSLNGEDVKLTWYFNDKIVQDTHRRKVKLSEDSSGLIIKNLMVEDLGEYKCVGVNKFGTDVKKISLYFNIKPVFTKEPKDVISSLSKNVTIYCEAKGYPNPVIQWFKLFEDKKTIIKEFKVSNSISFDLTKQNSGYYLCKAINLLGSIEKIIKVGYFGK